VSLRTCLDAWGALRTESSVLGLGLKSLVLSPWFWSCSWDKVLSHNTKDFNRFCLLLPTVWAQNWKPVDGWLLTVLKPMIFTLIAAFGCSWLLPRVFWPWPCFQVLGLRALFSDSVASRCPCFSCKFLALALALNTKFLITLLIIKYYTAQRLICVGAGSKQGDRSKDQSWLRRALWGDGRRIP